mmetsp:Transcript_3757/g.8015  ORF Transcript_3757/g.8015 Transcript_3757/m.8015 type:complete len:151 (+) Transcript_3757:240-692(+)
MGCSCLRGEGNHPITKGEKPGPKPTGDGLYSSALGEGGKHESSGSGPHSHLAGGRVKQAAIDDHGKTEEKKQAPSHGDDREVGEQWAPKFGKEENGKIEPEGKDLEIYKHAVHLKEDDQADYKEGSHGASNPNAKGGDLVGSEQVVAQLV